jgi:hypothetical protein
MQAINFLHLSNEQEKQMPRPNIAMPIMLLYLKIYPKNNKYNFTFIF